MGGGRISCMKIQLGHKFEDIISVENLLLAWLEFLAGKRNKLDVQVFESHLMHNIVQLYDELANGTYKHGQYYQFCISDPKPRVIHKASVRDRVFHHAIYRQLYPFFNPTFIADTYSCRIEKGTHRAMNRFRVYARKVSRNNTRTCWILKGDVKKFFASIDHAVLLDILAQHIPNLETMLLLEEVIDSFSASPPRRIRRAGNTPPSLPYDRGGTTVVSPPSLGGVRGGIGLPLGNLTSQLFCNIYMNEFDQFVKHKLKAQYYIRYADDFVILSDEHDWIVHQIVPIKAFLEDRLKLQLHPDKLFIKTLASGLDFLGWVHYPYHRVLRTATKKRMMRRIQNCYSRETLQSYLGLLSHGNTYLLQQVVKNRRNF